MGKKMKDEWNKLNPVQLFYLFKLSNPSVNNHSKEIVHVYFERTEKFKL